MFLQLVDISRRYSSYWILKLISLASFATTRESGDPCNILKVTLQSKLLRPRNPQIHREFHIHAHMTKLTDKFFDLSSTNCHQYLITHFGTSNFQTWAVRKYQSWGGNFFKASLDRIKIILKLRLINVSFIWNANRWTIIAIVESILQPGLMLVVLEIERNLFIIAGCFIWECLCWFCVQEEWEEKEREIESADWETKRSEEGRRNAGGTARNGKPELGEWSNLDKVISAARLLSPDAVAKSDYMRNFSWRMEDDNYL